MSQPEFPGFVDIGSDPMEGRLVWFIYGRPKTGKTSMFMHLVERHPDQRVFILSADKGTQRIRANAGPYKGKIAIAYPMHLKEWRTTVRQLREKVIALRQKKAATDVWIVIDTVNMMQAQLLTESRKIAAQKQGKGGKLIVPEGQDPNAAKNDSTRVVDDAAYARDIQTQLDWGINLALMTELTNEILALPVNVVFIALEKTEKDEFERNIAVPALSGQTNGKILGDADIIARLRVERGERKLYCTSRDGECYAGDRTDKLDEVECGSAYPDGKIDLYMLHRKACGLPLAPAAAPDIIVTTPAAKPVT